MYTSGYGGMCVHMLHIFYLLLCAQTLHIVLKFICPVRPGWPFSCGRPYLHWTTVGMPYSQCLDNMCTYLFVYYTSMSRSVIATTERLPPRCDCFVDSSQCIHYSTLLTVTRPIPLLVPSCISGTFPIRNSNWLPCHSTTVSPPLLSNTLMSRLSVDTSFVFYF